MMRAQADSVSTSFIVRGRDKGDVFGKIWRDVVWASCIDCIGAVLFGS